MVFSTLLNVFFNFIMTEFDDYNLLIKEGSLTFSLTKFPGKTLFVFSINSLILNPEAYKPVVNDTSFFHESS